MEWGIAIGIAIAAVLYLVLSKDKPAKVVRSIFVRGEPGRSDEN